MLHHEPLNTLFIPRESRRRRPMSQLCDFELPLVEDYDVQEPTLQRGMWFDVCMGQDIVVQYRLSWISPMRSRLVFTTREGFDAFVRTESEVLTMLRDRLMRRLPDDAVLEQPLPGMSGSTSLALAE